MFSSVKDKTNLLEHNIWTCGDYANSIQGFNIYNATAIVSSEKSINGDHSIKINKNEEASSYVQLLHTFNLVNDYTGKTVKLTANIQNNTDGTIALQLQCLPDGALKTVSISPNEEFGLVEISDSSIPADTTSIKCALAYPFQRDSSDVFTDDWKLIIE